MSIELPEAKILEQQMNNELKGKRIESYHLQDCEKLQRIGMLNKNTKDFDPLVNSRVKSIMSRGNVLLVKLNNGMNLILAPEYGGEIFYYTRGKVIPDRFHLKVDFDDGTALTVRLTSMGVIQAMRDDDLQRSYVYSRDFDVEKLSPLNAEFTYERFSKLLASNNTMLKSILVGKDAAIVGLSNSAFQDIIYRARLHPKRKASDLNEKEKQALYDAIRFVLQERIRLKGKDQFYDLYKNKGNYTPSMGPNMKQQKCTHCGTPIEKLSLGGGQIYICPKCQT